MASKEAAAEQERINKRVRAQERRLDVRLLGKGPPRKVRRGRFTKKAKEPKAVVLPKSNREKTISGGFKRAAEALSGETTRQRVRRATE